MKKLKFIVLVTIVLLISHFVYSVTYRFVEPKAYDYMVRHVLTEKLPFDNHKNVYGHNDIVLVVIDDKTVEKYKWPWKRELECKIFDYFYEYAKPKVLVQDAIITALDENNPKSDERFFNSIKRIDNLVEGFMFGVKPWENEKEGLTYDNKFVNKFGINVSADTDNLPYLYGSLLPFPEKYFNAVNHAGSVVVFPGFIDGNLLNAVRDEVYRNSEYIINYKGVILPSLAMKAFLIANNYPKTVITKDFIYFPELNYKIKQISTKYQMIVPTKYYKMYPYVPYSHKAYSAVDIMDSFDNIKAGKKAIIPPEEFKDKIVLLGANVPAGAGLNDNKNSPLTANHPGLDIQATNIDNIIHNDFLFVLPKWFNIILTLFGMIAVYFIIYRRGIVKSIIYSALILILYYIAVWVCYYNSIVINVSTFPVICITTMLFGYINKYITEYKNKEKVKSAMGKYMSDDVMENILRNIDNLGLGGKRANVTVLFSDIRGFTSMSEKMSASQVSALLNEYFSEMEPIVSKYNGIINKFIGDAIMAVFGEPIQDNNHPLNGVMCGYEMLEKVKELQTKWEKEGKPLFEIGVGINTGEVFVGNIGSEKRMEYTVIGDTVNLASRLESYNKMYNTKILISSNTYEVVKDNIEVNKIENVEIRGKAQHIDIYEVTKIISS